MPPTADSRRIQAETRTGGFAILITLGLLAFLVLLLLALAALTKVETRNAAGELKQTQARQNALMALTIALGRLQKFAGPDGRVTATAEAFRSDNGASHYTGVWNAANPGATPLTWLVSGSEGANPLGVTSAGSGEAVELVGAGTSVTANDVMAPKQAVIANDVPGQAGATVVGNYAWWVGDQGVKAPVSLADRTGEITYAPYDAVELRRRIRQQVALGAGPADATGQTEFEPRDAANTPLSPKVLMTGQLALLRRPDGVTPVGSDTVRRNFFVWSADNCAVLAATKPGGLRQDLSLKPELLGSAFAAWADYSRSMEDPAAPTTPAILPAYPAVNPRDALRRRHRLTAPQNDAGVAHGVAPVLSYFLITFNVRTDQSVGGSIRPLEVRARWMMSFWNPYTSSLVPEDLQLEVTGLPVLQVIDDTAGATVASIPLDTLYGTPLRIALPWQAAGRDDQQSWLPGRVYTWSAQENLNKGSAPPIAGFSSIFYTRTLSSAAGQGVQRAFPFATMVNSAQAHLLGGPTQLAVKLYRNMAGGGRELLRTHLSPAYSAFATTPAAANAATYQFSYLFRLVESTDTPASPETWLCTAGQDPREAILPADSFLSGANGPRPELYPNYTSISFPDRLLDRALPASSASVTGQSYNEDTPLFELPRDPLLSVGELQQLAVVGARPFAVGNSWGQSGSWNQVFDRYFFSGLSVGVGFPDLPAGDPLPNPLLRVAGHKSDGTPVTAADLAAEAATGYSAKYLVQRGAFNVNSVNPDAWLAVLRAGRFSAGIEFSYLAASASTGTQADAPTATTTLGDAVFFRFPFSAQETYRADPGYAASTTVPPALPNNPSAANTHLFRRGVRVLSNDQSVALAGMIAALVRQKLAASGPFGSLEEFLGPSSLYGGVSLLERAIADAVTSDGKHLNDPSTVAEFSSQWLTQGDLMGLLAPLFFPRSDTFMIRAYGDSVNPATGDLEGRAWCEAMVQRLPDYVDSTQPAETAPVALSSTNQAYGRRFRITLFRWLAPTDI